MKFSIVTPTLNRASMLESALRSVLDQGYSEYEHLIIDGGSTDETAAIVGRFGGVRFFSSPDQGMYDALNKGLELVQGDIVGFLNSDDLYGPEIFASVARRFEEPSVCAVVGNATVFVEDQEGHRRVIDRFSPVGANMLECTAVGSNYFNAWFFRKSVFGEIGMFDERYRIAGDRDFMIRFIARGLKYVTVERLAYQYRRHPRSLTFTSDIQYRRDTTREIVAMVDHYARKRTLPAPMMKLLWRKRTLATVEMAVRYLKTRDMRSVTYYAWVGTRSDSTWPIRFLIAALQRRPAQLPG